jgi:hypothetical protein
MTVFDVSNKVDDSGEYVLGVDATGSHACYLIYGVMQPHEKGRTLKPGKGHEELILAVKGEFSVSGDAQGVLRQGQAIHLKGDETCLLENTTGEKAVYVISGGHVEHNHH